MKVVSFFFNKICCFVLLCRFTFVLLLDMSQKIWSNAYQPFLTSATLHVIMLYLPKTLTDSKMLSLASIDTMMYSSRQESMSIFLSHTNTHLSTTFAPSAFLVHQMDYAHQSQNLSTSRLSRSLCSGQEQGRHWRLLRQVVGFVRGCAKVGVQQ